MAKIDLNALKKQRQEQEAKVEDNTPAELKQSYINVWGKNKEEVQYIELAEIVPFKDKKGKSQPFKISKDKVEQIKISVADIGIVTPLIVRNTGEKYQIISGHHRFVVAKELNLLTVPCVVREISDDEAIKYVAECNIQRSRLLPTEYAEIYSRYMEMRSDIDMTAQEIADKFGISKKSLYRYIKILKLTDDLKSLVDTDMIHTDTAEVFSEFSEENQKSVYECVIKNGKKVNRGVAKAMEIIVAEKEGENVSPEEFEKAFEKKKTFKNSAYNKFASKFKVDYSEDEWNTLIEALLDAHFKERID